MSALYKLFLSAKKTPYLDALHVHGYDQGYGVIYDYTNFPYLLYD